MYDMFINVFEYSYRMKVEINKSKSEIDAEVVIERKITGSGHITMPKKYVGHNAVVAIKKKVVVRHWNEGYLRKFRERGDKKVSI